MTINSRLFDLLTQKGLKQADLAKHLNVSQNVVTNWKQRGNNPPAEYIIPICDFLGISVHVLLGTSSNDFDSKILAAYHAAEPGTQKSVLKLLDVELDAEPSSNLYTSKIG